MYNNSSLMRSLFNEFLHKIQDFRRKYTIPSHSPLLSWILCKNFRLLAEIRLNCCTSCNFHHASSVNTRSLVHLVQLAQLAQLAKLAKLAQ